MAFVLDAAVHMRAADFTGVSLDCRRRVDDLKLVAVLKHFHIVSRHHSDDRERRSFRLPAFGAATRVVVCDVTGDGDLHGFVLAFADKGPAGEIARALLHAAIDRWVDMNSHGPILLVFDVLDSEYDDRTDRLALVHQIESLVDLFQFEDVGDHRIDLDLPVHVPVNDFRHVGAASRAAECRTLPDAAGHQLERPGRDFLTGFRNSDHDRDAP